MWPSIATVTAQPPPIRSSASRPRAIRQPAGAPAVGSPSGRTHRAVAGAVVALPTLAGGVAVAWRSGWPDAIRVLTLLAVVLIVVAVGADGFDRRHPASGLGPATGRVMALAAIVGLALTPVLDHWLFGWSDGLGLGSILPAAAVATALLVAATALRWWAGRAGPWSAPSRPELGSFDGGADRVDRAEFRWSPAGK